MIFHYGPYILLTVEEGADSAFALMGLSNSIVVLSHFYRAQRVAMGQVLYLVFIKCFFLFNSANKCCCRKSVSAGKRRNDLPLRAIYSPYGGGEGRLCLRFDGLEQQHCRTLAFLPCSKSMDGLVFVYLVFQNVLPILSLPIRGKQ